MGGFVARELGVSAVPITLPTVIGWLTQIAVCVLVAMVLILVVQIFCAVLYHMTGMEVFALFLPKKAREEGERREGDGQAHVTSLAHIVGRCVSGFAAVLVAPFLIALVLSVILTVSKLAGA